MQSPNSDKIDQNAAKNASLWIEGNYDEETKNVVRELLRSNPLEATDAFYTQLSFGTGGLRGLMGVGSNRINKYTIRAATQGLANYILEHPVLPSKLSVLIGFDSRHHSQEFAEETAKVLAGNGIRAYLYKELRPTPLVSFGCRLLGCTAGVMITASHNPPQYNGYKVYWSDGGQVLPPHDSEIIREVNRITDPAMVKTVTTLDHPLITIVSEEIDAAYLAEGCRQQHYPTVNQSCGNDLEVLYTSLHGTGITLVPSMLAAWGFSNVKILEEQAEPNGDFPTVPYPNPEQKEALFRGVKKLKETRRDLLIATDPDADRIGIVVRHGDSLVQLSGNQVACILLSHICEALTKTGTMPRDAAFTKTIVTTELFRVICQAYNATCVEVLSGFKYIAAEILKWESSMSANRFSFVFGGEDSCGYLLGTSVRDKDGVLIAALACEAALHAKRQGKTLVDTLHDLYRQHGVYAEDMLSITFGESKEGKDKMSASISQLRRHLPNQIGGLDVSFIDDYTTSMRTELKTGKTERLLLPVSNVLTLWLTDGTKLVVRPSGTEPKVKLYCGLVDKSTTPIETAEANCRLRLKSLLNALRKEVEKEIR